MKRWILVPTVVLLALAFTGPAAAAPVTQESFEAGFGHWVPDTDGRAPVSKVTLSTEQAFHGIRSVQILMDGRHDDGTSWVEAQFTGPPWTRVRVSLTFQLWSRAPAAAGGWLVVGYAGTADPEAEADFTRLGHTEITAGWRPYYGSWTFRTDATGRFRVALGTSVVWEVQKSHHIDFVRVDLVTV